MSYNFRSLFVTGLFGLMLPLCVIAGFFVTFFAFGFIPVLHTFSVGGTHQLIHILQTFGSGNVLQGCFVIGVAVSMVSTLFDVCNVLILSRPIR